MIWIPILTTLLLASAPSDKPARAVGYVPSGSPVDLHDLGRLARLRDPGVKVLSFGSHHRTEGNDDGANGTHSKLRVEEGNSVLAELDGPGIIQHIWLARAGGDQPDKLDWRKKRLKIHLDGKPDPALDIPLETLFSGAHPHFPRPLVMEESEGFVCYVPIAFREGCKVVVEGEGPWLYQINMLSLPDGSEIEPFQADPAPETASELERARSFWSEPAAYESKILAELPTAIYKLDGVGNSEHVFILPPGPATIRSIELEPTEATADAWRSARLRLVWDQGAGGEPAVNLPVAFAFGTLADTIPFSSLLVGQRDGTWYNRFPMPYRNQAVLRVNATQPIRGTFQVRFEKGIPDHAGYLRADFREVPTTRPNEVFNWLDERGRGHFAGVLMSSGGQANPSFRLEWEWVDRFQIDGNETSNSFHRDWSALGGRLDGPVASPSRGFPIHRISEEGAWRAAAYHWRVADPVPFATSIEAGLHRVGDNALEANHRASVFWYSNEPREGAKPR